MRELVHHDARSAVTIAVDDNLQSMTQKIGRH